MKTPEIQPLTASSSILHSVPELLSALEEKELQLQLNHQTIQTQQEQLENQQEQIQSQHQKIHNMQIIVQLLEEKLRLAKQKRFAASSEKMPLQMSLFDEAELEVRLDELNNQLPEDSPPKPAKRKVRKGFSDKLPRIRIDLCLTEAEKAGASKTFFTKIKEELDIIPAKAQILEYWQERAVFDTEDGGQQLKAATQPLHPLGKCQASVSLITYILVSKYADALPLYRLEKILARYGGHFSRTAMANWIIRLEDVFKPLLNLMREQQLCSNYLQMDETRLQVLKEDGKAATSDKWMWVIRGGPPGQPVVLFEYDPSRSAQVPLRMLEGFTGVLQADGYASYNQACKKYGITRIGCWDHVRRKFVESSKASPGKVEGKPSKADIAIGQIGKLYRIETEIQDMTPEQRKAQRQLRSKPLLDDLKTWLEQTINVVLKDGLTWVAINYALNQWPLLTGYCDDGHLQISNALAENAIRPFAVGRRNWLFADTSRGAKASAACYSLIETAKANGLDPYRYIGYVLKHIATADTVEKLEALLPWNMPS